MFQNTTLKDHLETTSGIKTQSAVIAEWNMNFADNILKAGNYRFRPTDSTSDYYQIASSFSVDDPGNFYTGATDADIVIDGGFEDDGTPVAFTSKKQKRICCFPWRIVLDVVAQDRASTRQGILKTSILTTTIFSCLKDQDTIWQTRKTPSSIGHLIGQRLV